MNKRNLLIIVLIVSLCITLFGAWLKIIHEEGADLFLQAGIITSLLFTVIALYEVLSSTRINRLEKVLWSLGLVLAGSIVGLVYVFAERSRIANHP